MRMRMTMAIIIMTECCFLMQILSCYFYSTIS